MNNVLIVVTNHPFLGNTDQANGTYSPELTHVVAELNKAGINYKIASINGGSVPLYGTDIEGDDVNQSILSDSEFKQQIANSQPLNDIEIQHYDAIFYPGGFGLLSDLAANEDMAKIAAAHYESGGIISAVCHGPAALLPIKLSNGEPLLSGKNVTAFSREEEIDFGTIDDIPFLLEESLTRVSGSYSKVQPWGEFIIEDDRIITGQNPASAHAVGQALVNKLAKI